MQAMKVCSLPSVHARQQARPHRTTRLHASRRRQESGYHLSIHGRHVDVTPELEEYVRARFDKTLEKLYTAEYIEAEGGLQEVDIRLMNTRADIKLRPAQTNKALHDTYLRMGELKADAQGHDVYDSFNKAAATLDKKLHKITKAGPHRKDLKQIAQNWPATSGIARKTFKK